MCNKLREIKNPYTGKCMLVKCGYCESCLMEKAARREVRLHLEMEQRRGLMSFFITLNYSNRFVPYVFIPEFDGDEQDTYSVYRNYIPRIVYHRHSTRYTLKVTPNTSPLCEIPSDKLKYFIDNVQRTLHSDKGIDAFPKLTNCKNRDIMGVCLSQDFSNFVKRIRRRIEYHELPRLVSYWRVAEYGPTTFRPHFHAVLTFDMPSNSYNYKTFIQLKAAIMQSWPFCSLQQIKQNVEIARNPEQYVSRYISSNTRLPYCLQRGFFAPKPSHSLYYGFSNIFTPDKVLQAAITSSPTYTRCVAVDKGISVLKTFLFPDFILRFYFPKCKGICYLSDGQIQQFFANYFNRRTHYWRFGFEEKEIQSFEKRIKRARRALGVSTLEYSWLYVRLYQTIRNFYNNDLYDEYDVSSHYYNIGMYRHGINPYVNAILFDKSGKFRELQRCKFDPNKHPYNVARNLQLQATFEQSYKKVKHHYRVYQQKKFCDESYISNPQNFKQNGS